MKTVNGEWPEYSVNDTFNWVGENEPDQKRHILMPFLIIPVYLILISVRMMAE